MKFLTQFATLAQFNNFTLDSTNTPNVSLIKDNNYGIQYTKYIPPVTPVHDYSQDYFTIEAIDNIEFIFSYSGYTDGTLYYSINNGNTWDEMNSTVSLSAGDKILFKGLPESCKGSFDPFSLKNGEGDEIDGRFNVEGNIMSLIYGDNFIGQTSFPQDYEYIFCLMFDSQINLINAGNLILPATTLTDGCYYNMFSGCSSLTTAPELPATTLADCCYLGMFRGCTALTTAPELPATTLANLSYYEMFKGCTSLNYIKCLATNISAYDCLRDWVKDIVTTGTFVKDSNTNFQTGNSGIPSGWTVQDYVAS